MQKTVGEYEFCEEIGRGYSGRVFRAIHKPAQKPVAITVYSKKMMARMDGTEHDCPPTEFYCGLMHENILQCYDYFTEGDHGYLVTEYIDGANMRQCIQQACADWCSCSDDDHDCLKHIIDTARKICRGLIYLHEKKVVHGHIKPENILVSHEVDGPFQTHKQVKIADFAMAGLVKGFFQPSADVKGGTLKYMSPEQIKRKKMTFQSDIFSLGVTLYELFTGHYPWGESADRKKLPAKLLSPKYRPPLPTQYVSFLPKHLDATLMKMLEKDEKKRHSNMAEVWLDLSKVEMARI